MNNRQINPAETAGIHLEYQQGIAFINLDRPATRNSFDLSMGVALRDCVRSLIARPPKVVVLRSTGEHFMVGGDVRHFQTLLAESKAACAEELELLIGAVNEAVSGLTELPCPVLGLLNGSVAGFGLSLALACDILVAAEDAQMLMAYGAIGASPDGGATWHLPRHVGLHRALSMALLNTRMDAHQAKALGLVVQVVPAIDLPNAGLAIANRLANGAGAAQAGVKRLLREALRSDLAGSLEAEKALFITLSATDDFAEGVNAFCQRRSANFTATL